MTIRARLQETLKINMGRKSALDSAKSTTGFLGHNGKSHVFVHPDHAEKFEQGMRVRGHSVTRTASDQSGAVGKHHVYSVDDAAKTLPANLKESCTTTPGERSVVWHEGVRYQFRNGMWATPRGYVWPNTELCHMLDASYEEQQASGKSYAADDQQGVGIPQTIAGAKQFAGNVEDRKVDLKVGPSAKEGTPNTSTTSPNESVNEARRHGRTWVGKHYDIAPGIHIGGFDKDPNQHVVVVSPHAALAHAHDVVNHLAGLGYEHHGPGPADAPTDYVMSRPDGGSYEDAVKNVGIPLRAKMWPIKRLKSGDAYTESVEQVEERGLKPNAAEPFKSFGKTGYERRLYVLFTKAAYDGANAQPETIDQEANESTEAPDWKHPMHRFGHALGSLDRAKWLGQDAGEDGPEGVAQSRREIKGARATLDAARVRVRRHMGLPDTGPEDDHTLLHSHPQGMHGYKAAHPLPPGYESVEAGEAANPKADESVEAPDPKHPMYKFGHALGSVTRAKWNLEDSGEDGPEGIAQARKELKHARATLDKTRVVARRHMGLPATGPEDDHALVSSHPQGMHGHKAGHPPLHWGESIEVDEAKRGRPRSQIGVRTYQGKGSPRKRIRGADGQWRWASKNRV
jgi:hypothetical protein